MSQGEVLNYADAKLRRRLRKKVLAAVLLVTLIALFGLRQVMDTVTDRLLPERYVAAELLEFISGEASFDQAKSHIDAIKNPAFLAPIATQLAIPLQTLQQNLSIKRDALTMLRIEYLSMSQTEAITVSRTIAIAYEAAVTGSADRMSRPRLVAAANRRQPHAWAKVADVGKVLINACLLVLVMRTRYVQRMVWQDM